MGEVVGVEDWLEVQLLDCQNLARRHGLAEVAGLLDRALDLLGDRSIGADLPEDEPRTGALLPFRIQPAAQRVLGP